MTDDEIEESLRIDLVWPPISDQDDRDGWFALKLFGILFLLFSWFYALLLAGLAWFGL